MATFILKTVQCHTTEDNSRSDELYINLNGARVHGPEDIRNHSSISPNITAGFTNSINVQLWDEDSWDPDDMIGEFDVSDGPQGDDHRDLNTSSGASYTVYYSIEDGVPRAPRQYPDGMLVQGPVSDLYIVVNRQLWRIDEPLARDPALGTGNISIPRLSALELQGMERGATMRALVEAEQEDEVVSDMPRRYMSTHAWLSQESGRIDADTRTWTMQPWLGYTLGVMVLFGGANGEYLGRTDLHQFGVDGFRIPFKQWQRLDHWDESVPFEISRGITTLVIKHTHAPKERLLDILNQIAQVGEALAPIITTIAAL
jgi:hypothetical protein